MARALTAEKLFRFLTDLKNDGVNLKKVNVYHRPDRNSDESIVKAVEEDLFDSETNKILTSIMLLNNPSEDPTPRKVEKIQNLLFGLFDIADNLENDGNDKDAKKMRKTLYSILKQVN